MAVTEGYLEFGLVVVVVGGGPVESASYKTKSKLRPVSYTHLDVYKRQEKSRSIKPPNRDGGTRQINKPRLLLHASSSKTKELGCSIFFYCKCNNS